MARNNRPLNIDTNGGSIQVRTNREYDCTLLHAKEGWPLHSIYPETKQVQPQFYASEASNFSL
jgi:hypothetical protein